MGKHGTSGTSWPLGIDTACTEIDFSTKARAAVPNDISQAVVAIENSLGIQSVWSGAYSTFSDAITAANSSGKTLIISTSVTLPAGNPVSITSPMFFLGSGKINKGSATSLSIGPITGNPMHQIFYGFGAGEITGLTDAYPEWFTSFNNAVTVLGAVNPVTLHITLVTSVDLTSTVTLGDNITLSFHGAGMFIKSAGTGTNFNLRIHDFPLRELFRADTSLSNYFTAGDVRFGGQSQVECFPEWFGAKGDNNTDDYDAIEAAYQAIKNNNGNSLVLSKKYKYGTGLSIDTKITIRGTHGHFWQANATVDTNLTSALSYTGNGHAIVLLNTCTLKDFSVQGTATAVAGVTVQVGTTGGLTFDNMDISGFTATNAHGLKINGQHVSKINKCSFRGNRDGLSISGNVLTVSDCAFIGNSRYGIVYNGTTEMSGLLISNPVLQDNGDRGICLIETGGYRIYNPTIISPYLENNCSSTPGSSILFEGISEGSLFKPTLIGGECFVPNVNGNTAVEFKNTYGGYFDTRTINSYPPTSVYSNTVYQFKNGGGNVGLQWPRELSSVYEEYSGDKQSRRLPSLLGTGPFVNELIAHKADVVDDTPTGFIRVKVPNNYCGGFIIVDYIANIQTNYYVTGQIKLMVARYQGNATAISAAITETIAQEAISVNGAETTTITWDTTGLTGAVGATQTFDIRIRSNTTSAGATHIKYHARVLSGNYIDTSMAEIILLGL